MHVHKEILLNLARNMHGFGFIEQEIFDAAGFEISKVCNEFDMVNSEYGIKLWEVIIEKSGYQLVGLSFGKNINFSALSWIAALTQSASTLKDAWKSFCDFSLLMGDMYYYELQENANEVSICFYPNQKWLESSAVTAIQATSHAMSLCMSLSAFLCGRTVELNEAQFAFNINNKYMDGYEKVFGNVKFNAKENKLIFNRNVAEILVITHNEPVYKHMLVFCEQKLKEISTENSYADKVKKILTQKNSFYLPKLDEISAMLHLSSRTLQRKLKEENLNYQQLVEEHQIGHAKNLLKQKDIQVKEIAYLLGYANTESFNRAFKKNTGLSPRGYKL